ncbi:MAG: hypothetical protein ABIE70_09750 [bacterium]
MNKTLNRIRSARGTTMIEILIALAMTSLVTVAILKTYITQHEQYVVQEDVSDIQQNARAAIDELSRHCRMAGYSLPTGMDPIVASNTNPDTITINYKDGDCDTYLSNPMPQPSAELKCATDVSCFQDGDWVFIFEPDSGGGEWFELTEVQAAAKHLQHNTMPLSKKYGADAIIVKINQVKFYIDNTTDPDHPTLMLKTPGQQPQIYADNISDLQFTYRMKNDSLEAEPDLPANIREVLIQLTGRSHRPDSERGAEGEDFYRTRTFASSVNVRNLNY